MAIFRSKKKQSLSEQKHAKTSSISSTNSVLLDSNSKTLKEKPSDDKIDRLFEEAASRLDININDASVKELSTDKKWFILCNESALTSIGTVAGRKSSNSYSSASIYPNDSISSAGTIRSIASDSEILSPIYYIQSLVNKNNKTDRLSKLVTDLSVRLRTMPLRWAQNFIENDGIKVLFEELASINKIGNRVQRESRLELEIIKCLRQLFNNYYGIQQVVSDPSYIVILTQSILSSSLPTQRLVCDALTFMCYFDQPRGHAMVLEGMDKIKETRSDYGRFDAWLKSLINVLDSRCKTGSIASINMRQNTSKDSDIPLTEYALANLLLILAVTDPDTIDNRDKRITLRNQLYQAGLSQVIEKMYTLNNELINLKLEEFAELEDSDAIAHMALREESTEPEEILETIVASIRGTRAYDYLQRLLQHLLLLQCDPETKNRYYQLIEHFVSHINLDGRGVTGSFSNTYGLTVKDLIAKFAEEDELEATLQELDEARAIATNALEREAALRIQIDLKADGLVGKYRIKAETLERSLHVANQTNAVLQQKLRDIESDHKQTLELMEAQIKRLYNTVCYLVSKIDEMPETVETFDSIKSKISTSVDLIHERRKSKPLPIPKKKLSTEQKASIVAESLIEERATSSHTPPASPTDIHKIPNLITNTSMPSITEITPPHTPPNKTPENSVASRNSKPPVSLIELELTHPSQSSSSKSVASLFSNFNTQESDSLSSSVSTSAA
ncbi:Cytokinesis protein sepA, partial [Choanephora cucurbitarum]